VAEDLGAVAIAFDPAVLVVGLEEVSTLFFPISPKDAFPLL
jgi:hypothetical protein